MIWQYEHNENNSFMRYVTRSGKFEFSVQKETRDWILFISHDMKHIEIDSYEDHLQGIKVAEDTVKLWRKEQ